MPKLIEIAFVATALAVNLAAAATVLQHRKLLQKF